MSIINTQLRQVYNSEDVNDVTELIFKFILLKLMGILFTFVLTIIITIINENLMIIVIPTLSFEIIILIILFFYQIRTSKDLLTFAILEVFFDLIFKVLIIISIKNQYSKLYSLSTGIIHLILNLLSFTDQNKVLFLSVLFFTNFFYYLTCLFIFLRVDLLVKWSISVCLWPVYLYLLIINILGLFKLKIFYNSTKKLSLRKCKNIVKCINKLKQKI